MNILLLSLGLGHLLFSSKVQSFQIEKKNEDHDAVGAMTTLEPIDTFEAENCALYLSCEECLSRNCTWIHCPSTEACDEGPDELCPPALSCNKDTTTAQPSTVPVPTTTDNPETNQTTTYQSTTSDPVTNQTTTEFLSTTIVTNQPSTSTEPVTTHPTTNSPTNIPTTKQPDTTIAPVTDTTTLSTSTSASTTTAVPAHPGHFDAASFVGGIILCASLTAVGYAGYKFYLKRFLAPTYSNF